MYSLYVFLTGRRLIGAPVPPNRTRCRGRIGTDAPRARHGPVRSSPVGSSPGGGRTSQPHPGWGYGGAAAASRPPATSWKPRAARNSAAPSLELQVRLEPVQPALPPEPRLLVAAERRSWVKAVVRVRPHHARAQALRHPQDPRPL